MFIDASAIVAILLGESDADTLLARIEGHLGERYISPLVRFETTAALVRSQSGKRRPTPEAFAEAEEITDAFCESIQAEDITITPTIGKMALLAGRTYGKLVGHPADLNFGDCYAYACATAYDVPLLYKGNDFSQTDLA